MTSYAPVTSLEAARLPWGTTPGGEFDRKGETAAFILGGLAVFLTFPLGIAGIVLSCMGLDRLKTNPPAAQKFLMVSWIVFIPGAILGALLLILGVASLMS